MRFPAWAESFVNSLYAGTPPYKYGKELRYPNTQQPLYNTVRYNTILDTTRFKDGSQKCIDYIEKWP